MSMAPPRGPQHSRVFTVVAFFTRLRLKYLHTTSRHRDFVAAIYLFLAGITALGTITMMAFFTDMMLLFPPLGPSAFILFYTPLSESASPRNLVLGHTTALLAGLGALYFAQLIFPQFNAASPGAMNWSQVTAVALAMGMASLAMVVVRCVHPPAVATALIAAMGYLDGIVQIGGVLVAVLFLGLEAYLFNRVLGGLPYPLWQANPQVDKLYHSLAGRPAEPASRWQKLTQKTFQRR